MRFPGALLSHDSADARGLFVACVRAADRLPSMPRLPASHHPRAARGQQARPVELTGPALALVRAEPAVLAGIQAAMSNWPRRLAPGECNAAVGVLATDDVLRAVLDTALVNDPGLERLLTSIRAVMLETAVHGRAKASREALTPRRSRGSATSTRRVRRFRRREPRACLAADLGARRTREPHPVPAIHLIALACARRCTPSTATQR